MGLNSYWNPSFPSPFDIQETGSGQDATNDNNRHQYYIMTSEVPQIFCAVMLNSGARWSFETFLL
jgi:hypothetical protein